MSTLSVHTTVVAAHAAVFNRTNDDQTGPPNTNFPDMINIKRCHFSQRTGLKYDIERWLLGFNVHLFHLFIDPVDEHRINLFL